MQIHKNEVTTGILVLVSATALIAFLAVLGAPGLIKPLNTYKVYYDNASGIRPGAPVLLAGREIGKVTKMESPVDLDKRPPGHPDDEVAIIVQVDRKASIYRSVSARLVQQSMLGQQVIDFVHGDPTTGLAPNHTEFVGDRVPDISEAVSNQVKQLTGPGSDLAETLKNARMFMDALNHSHIKETIQNAEQMTDTLKKEPWRLVWPSTKDYSSDDDDSAKKKEPIHKKATH